MCQLARPASMMGCCLASRLARRQCVRCRTIRKIWRKEISHGTMAEKKICILKPHNRNGYKSQQEATIHQAS